MFSYNDSAEMLRTMGARIKAARIQRGDKQKTFAFRIGVSLPTLRGLESGEPTVAIGSFMNALQAVGRLDDMVAVLAGVGSTDQQRVRKKLTRSA